MRARYTLGLLWIAALVLAGWVLSQLPLAAILQSIEALTASQWLAWIVVNGLVVALLTWRWQLLTAFLVQPPGFYHLLQVRQAGQAVSFLTPGPQFGGEPLQIYWLWKRFGLKIHQAILGVGLDRFYELWVNFSVLFLAILLLPALSVSAVVNWQDMFLILVLLLTVLSLSGWLILKRPTWIAACLKKLSYPWRHHPRLQHIDSHWQALGIDLTRMVKEHKPVLLKAYLLSLAGWGAMLGELWLLLIFLDVPVNFSTYIVILVATRLAFLLPLPGGVGTLEAAIFWAFQSLDLQATDAVGLIALMRLRDVVIVCAGLIFMRQLNQRVLNHQPLA